MERRREPRIQIFEPVLLTVLGPIETQHWARALDLSGRGMKLVVPCPVQPGSAVKVQLEDALLLGDVCYSEAHGNEFVVGLNIRHALMGLNELTSLNSKLLNGWLPPASAQPQTNTNSQPTAPSRTGS